MQDNILTASAVSTLNPTITLYEAEIFKGESPVSKYYVV